MSDLPQPSSRRESLTQGPTYAIPRPNNFIPVTEPSNHALYPRGQRLSRILQHRASSDRYVDRNASPRRPSPRPVNGQAEQEWADIERGISLPTDSLEQKRKRDGRQNHGLISGDGRGITMDLDFEPPPPPSDFPLTRSPRQSERRIPATPSLLDKPMMRSERLIGNSNPRYRWDQYYKTEDELKTMKKPIRKYHERNNYLIQQYLYIDRLLDSSLPHNLIQEYNTTNPVKIPPTIREEPSSSTAASPNVKSVSATSPEGQSTNAVSYGPLPPPSQKIKRTKDLYKVPDVDENTPLLRSQQNGNMSNESNPKDDQATPQPVIPAFSPDEETDSSDRIVTVAIYLNLAANTLLLALKIVVTILTSSVSVLASLVDAALDFLSTAIVWTTTHVINSTVRDTHNYPVGRRRLEPLGVLIFSVIMITSFFQVALEALNRLTGSDRTIVELSPPALAIMATTVAVKAVCFLWCRLIRNSSVQALAQDAATDVVFNVFSILFPLAGYYLRIWYFDPLGGLLLSLYVITSWSLTTRTHILNLTGHAASADERNILLYLTMRFARSVRRIQGCTAYHAGDKLNVEVDIVLDEEMSLRDSHDLGESLQYVLESVPGVERAFVHADYADWNIATHLEW